MRASRSTHSPARRRPAASLRRAGVVALLAAAACRGDRGRDRAADTSLSRDLELAAQTAKDVEFADTVATAPAPARPQTTPRAPAPAPAPRTPAPRPRTETPTPAPAPTPAPVEPSPAPAPATARFRGIAAGSTAMLTTAARICTDSRPGDKFIATVREPVMGEDGAMIPAGAKVVVEVSDVTRGQRPQDTHIAFRVRTIKVAEATYVAGGVAVPTDTMSTTRMNTKGSDAKKVIGGAILGAVIGQAVGKDAKGTIIGAAAGAAAGTAAARHGDEYQGCLAPGSTLRLTLSQPVTM